MLIFKFYLRFSILLVFLSKISSHRSWGLSYRCDICCTSLFSAEQGVVNIKESTTVIHTLSYIIRCLFSSAEVILVSDDFLHSPMSLSLMTLPKVEGSTCTQALNVPVSLISVSTFVEGNHELFLKFVPASGTTASTFSPKVDLPSTRTNFIFHPNSEEQMLALIRKVDQNLQILRGDIKLFWQPYIIFLWPDIQFSVRGIGDKLMFQPDLQLLRSWFKNYTPAFTLDSGIFFCFMVQKGNSTRSQANLFLTLYEAYTVKGHLKWQKLTRLFDSDEEGNFRKVESADCLEREEQSILEKIQSYIFVERFSRRDNFEKLSVTASVKVCVLL